jgi:hypothetical protein
VRCSILFRFLFIVSISRGIFPLQAQDSGVSKPEILSNDNVLGMVKAGLSQDLIVTTIVHNGCSFQLDVDHLIALKQASVPDQVVRAMAAKDCQPGINPAKASRNPALGSVQGSLTWESRLLGHTGEGAADILLLKGVVEISPDSAVMITGKNLGVSAPADPDCIAKARAIQGISPRVIALAKCSKPGFESIKNQTGANNYEILERTAPAENGHFEIGNLAPGEYTLVIKSQDTKALTLRDALGKWFFVRVKIEPAKIVDASHDFGATEF